MEISTRLTGMARCTGMRVQPKFFSAELHIRAHPDSIPHKRRIRLPLPRCALWSSSSQQPQQSGSVASPSERGPDHNQLWTVSFLADKGVKPKEGGSRSSQERGKVSGSGGSNKAEQLYYKFFLDCCKQLTCVLKVAGSGSTSMLSSVKQQPLPRHVSLPAG